MFEAAHAGQPLPVAVANEAVDAVLSCLAHDRDGLIGLVRPKPHDDSTCMHSVAVSVLMAALAHQLGLGGDDTRRAAMAGLLHDIGKAFVPERILSKPGSLNAIEAAIMRSHPSRGQRLLAAVHAFDPQVHDVARHHHERLDGSGYPDGLVADQIGRFARMGAVCDVYDALTSNRPYKDAWEPARAMRQLHESARAGQLDAEIVVAFHALMGPYPLGSLVRLRCGPFGQRCGSRQSRSVSVASRTVVSPRIAVGSSAKRAR
jgi:putative nucleotidyltransferase with HDIG domain